MNDVSARKRVLAIRIIVVRLFHSRGVLEYW